jgi:hypothetical protein
LGLLYGSFYDSYMLYLDGLEFARRDMRGTSLYSTSAAWVKNVKRVVDEARAKLDAAGFFCSGCRR